ncbi:MAG TPA: M23 family metallopeptidase [Paenalcaligenes sp.]|nr:M23 family metallopeptidase [Paenalcaligenes sp.]
MTPPKRPKFIQKSLLTIALGLFVGAGAIAVVPPAQEPVPEIYHTSTMLEAPIIKSLQGQAGPFIHQTSIRQGDTLAAILKRLEVDEPDLQHFLTYDEAARAIYKLYPGRTIQVSLDENNKLQWLRYNHTPADKDDNTVVSRWLEVTPDEADGFVAKEHTLAAETEVKMAEGVITTSLFGATDKAGIPDSVALAMTDVLGSKIDFLKDIRKNDRFRVIYESHTSQGQTIAAGRILAIEYESDGEMHQALWFDEADGGGGYYDFEGNSIQGAFLRNAIKFTRISSTFGKRRHPIHGNWRNHNGVDYAAPQGTPIQATADGVVDFIGTQRGYGNVIIIKHHSGYSTLYAHQSRFESGLKKGAKVQQGQRIGYVGATGWATGPHLHYEFRIDGKPVDPLSVDLPAAKALESDQIKELQALAGQYKKQLALLKERTDHRMLAMSD